MQFLPVPKIESTRLLLALWQPEDALALTEALHESREHLLPWMPWAAAEPQPVEAKLALILDWREAFLEGRDFHYGIFEREGGRLLGALGLHPRVGPGGLEVGYWVRAGADGRGVATEATAAAARVALELMGAHRLELHLDARNPASERVAQKLEFVPEARLREWFEHEDGQRGDHLIYALLARELTASPAGGAPIRARGLGDELLLDQL